MQMKGAVSAGARGCHRQGSALPGSQEAVTLHSTVVPRALHESPKPPGNPEELANPEASADPTAPKSYYRVWKMTLVIVITADVTTTVDSCTSPPLTAGSE